MKRSMIYRPQRRRHNGEASLAAAAKALGCFSIGLGLAELFMPRQLGQSIGVGSRHQNLIRLLGIRELATGIGILSRQRPSAWMWSRVAGDAMDLAFLSVAFSGNPRNQRLFATTAAVAGVTLADLFLSERLSEAAASGDGFPEQNEVEITRAITIDKPAAELYQFWRNFKNLPRFMAHLEEVQVHDAGQSSWVARAPMGRTVTWDAELIEDRPHELIAWRSLPGSQVENSGQVSFHPAPGNRGTVVKVTIRYKPPAGPIGVLVAKLFGEEPGQQVKDDLRFFKQLMETGVIATTRGQPSGRKRGISKKFDHPTPRQTSLMASEVATH